MWDVRRETLALGERVRLTRAGSVATTAETLRALSADGDCRGSVLAALRSAPWPAYFWEMPPITRDGAERPFEYMALPAPALASTRADTRAFATRLAAPDPHERELPLVTVFENLPGDALLIAPRPVATALDCYAHFANFVRGAPESQQHQLLALLGLEACGALSERPLWISTCGLGAPWLHVRLDQWPKYYSYEPYRNWPADRN